MKIQVVNLVMYGRRVEGVKGEIATVLLDPSQVRDLGQEVPQEAFASGGRGLFAAHIAEGRIQLFTPLEFHIGDYENGHVNEDRRDRRAARIMGLLD